MIHHSKGLDMEIVDFEYRCDVTFLGEIIPSETSNLKDVEIIKVSDKSTYDISFERS